MLPVYFASIVDHIANTVDVITATSYSVLIPALAALTKKANTKGYALDIVVSFGDREIDPLTIAEMIQDTLALEAIHAARGGYFYHCPVTAEESEERTF